MERGKLLAILFLVAGLLHFTVLEAWPVSFPVVGFSADDNQLLTADIVAEVTNPPTVSSGTAVLVLQITNTTPSVAGFTDPVIAGFGFNLVGVWDNDDVPPPDSTASLDEVGTSIDTSGSIVDATGIATTNLLNTVVPSDFKIDLDKNFPASGGLLVDVQLADEAANNRGIVRSGAANVVPAEYIEGPVSFEFSFADLTGPIDLSAFPSVSPVNFIVRFKSAGNGGEDSGVATPIPEPATALLLGSGLLGLLGFRRRRFLKEL